MDKTLFEQLLTECAQWHYPTALDDTPERLKIRRMEKQLLKKGYTQQEIDEAMSEFLNDTFPPKITKLKIANETCDYCGDHCPGGRQLDYKLQKSHQGDKQWNGKCRSCRRQADPWTGEYTLDNSIAAGRWHEWIRNSERNPNIAPLPRPWHQETNASAETNPRPGSQQQKIQQTYGPDNLTAEQIKQKYGLDFGD